MKLKTKWEHFVVKYLFSCIAYVSVATVSITFLATQRISDLPVQPWKCPVYHWATELGYSIQYIDHT